MARIAYNPIESDYGFTSKNFTVDVDGNIYANTLTLADDLVGVDYNFVVRETATGLTINNSEDVFPTITISKNKNFFFQLLLLDQQFYIFDSTQSQLYVRNFVHESGDRGIDAQGKQTGILTINIPQNYNDTVLYYTNSLQQDFGLINIVDQVGIFDSITLTGDQEASALNTGSLIVTSGTSLGGNLVIGKDLTLANADTTINSAGNLTLAVDNSITIKIGDVITGSITATGLTIPLQNSVITNVTIDDSNINNTVIGNVTPTVGAFTELTVSQTTTEENSVTNKKYVDSKAIALAIAFGI